MYFRIARLDSLRGEYVFHSAPQDQRGARAEVREIYMRRTYIPGSMVWLVIGASSIPGLDAMLERLNSGKVALGISLDRFLEGVDEESAKQTEESVKYFDYQGPVGNTTHISSESDPEWAAMLNRAMKRGMDRAFNTEEKPEPTPDPTTEEKYPHRWSEEEKNRLLFQVWRLRRGAFDDDMVSEPA